MTTLNRIVPTYFPTGKYPARSSVSDLPQSEFLLEIVCEAVLE
jgi:uncharacterized protein (DUF3820 family)